MRKATYLFLLFLFFHWHKVIGQCITPPPVPAACTGAEPSLTDNETLNQGTTKWYYGPATTMNSLTMKGGTLIVCTDLTIDKFYMDSGSIYIRPGARFIVGSGIGSGLILDGNCAFYNYGFCEIQRNLSFSNAHVSATKPNIVINALPASVFRTANQYFVINSPYSYFVNNGSAEFWGIITDPLSTPGCVCLGMGSTTRMAVLINKIADTYVAPSGNACVNVYQLSQFNNRLTNYPTVYVCLGSGHTSYSGCGGCPANNWGSAQVFTGCVNCVAINVLPIQFTSFNATTSGTQNRLSWELSTATHDGLFRIMRSDNAKDFIAIDSFRTTDNNTTTIFNSIDKTPLKGDNFYMINYTHPQTGLSISSKQIQVTAAPNNGFAAYPMPFDHKFFISYPEGTHPDKIILTDIAGKNLAIRYTILPQSRLVQVEVTTSIPPGIYILHMKTDKQNMAKTILKR